MSECGNRAVVAIKLARVLIACSGENALELAENAPERIRVMTADVLKRPVPSKETWDVVITLLRSGVLNP